MNKFTLILLALLTSACATHSIDIAPNLRDLSADGALAPASVGYYISNGNYKKDVVQKSGTGGDSVSYPIYKVLEPALQKVLFERFESVVRTESAPTPQSMAAAQLKYTFVPEFSGSSFNDSFWTWPPKKFTLKCSIRALDASGKTVWSSKYQGVGEATNEDWQIDFAIAAKRAAGIVFAKMQKDIAAFAF